MTFKVVKSDMSTDRKRSRRPVKITSLPKLVPNILTICALCAGLTSIRFALLEKWELVIIAMLVAALFDVLDGAVARLLKASSKMGAELDSLSDFLSFGVAPALILYQWVIHNAGGIGWFASMAFATAAALRLARFNVMSKEAEDKGKANVSHFFVGVPAPAGALLSLIPLALSIHLDELRMEDFPIMSVFVAIWMLLMAGLMVSRIPTFSIKKLKVPQKAVFWLLAFLALVIGALVTEPWLTLVCLGVSYLGAIPLSYRLAKKRGFDKD